MPLYSARWNREDDGKSDFVDQPVVLTLPVVLTVPAGIAARIHACLHTEELRELLRV
jgi:hypothetical protein